MVCFARSGGTVLNQCLGVLPNVVMLSEVNPQGGGWGALGPDSHTTVRAQARAWFGMEVTSDDFADGVLELETLCDASGKRLVLRDWSYINSMPHQNHRGAPPGRFLTLEALEHRTTLIPFAFVRDAIDVWISRKTPPARDFFANYSAYVEAIHERQLPIFRYENFCRDPEQTLRRICSLAGLPFSHRFHGFASFTKVNGDVQHKQGSRGVRHRQIVPMPRKRIPREKIRELEACVEMRSVNRRLGYSARYHSARLEPAWPHWSRQVRGRLRRLLR